MGMITPKAIMTDVFVTDTNLYGQTGILIPLNISGKQIKGKLQVHADTMQEVSDIKRILAQQPKATYKGAYSIEITVYCPLEDELATFPEAFALDAYAAVMQLVNPVDMKIRWRN